MRRLKHAGFAKDFVQKALLPDWWSAECANDPGILPDVELRIARFLGLPISTVRDADLSLAPRLAPGTQLRRVKNLERDRLAPALHAALRIGDAVTRSLRDPNRHPARLPVDGLDWRAAIHCQKGRRGLGDILADLWERGIPVVPVDLLPSPTFQAAAFVVGDRPMIVIGHKHDVPGHVAFLVAHEAGHIAAGDCTAEAPVVDEEDEIPDDADVERRADLYAIRVLAGGDEAPPVRAGDFKELAQKAIGIERATGADASSIIYAWASRTRDYATAILAVKALYRSTGARKLLRDHFERNVDLDAASESDRALLGCVAVGHEPDAATH